MFRDNNNITVVYFECGSTITSIGFAAFYNNCIYIVNIPRSVTSIGANAFARNRLTNVCIPRAVNTLGVSAFRDNGLTAINISPSRL